jgi:hypothetical protein
VVDRGAAPAREVLTCGATIIAEVSQNETPDDVMMADPEGNEFDVL